MMLPAMNRHWRWCFNSV